MSQTSINNIINIQIVRQTSGIAERIVNNLAIFTKDVPTVPINNYAVYFDPNSVASDWGTNSTTYKMAVAIYSQVPNILTAGGTLMVIPMKENIEIPATAGTATSAIIVPTNFTNVENGSFKITIDANEAKELTGLNFTGVTDVEGVANVFKKAVGAVPATSGYLKTTALDVDKFAAVNNGSFQISVDGGEAVAVNTLDFTGVSTIQELALVIDSVLIMDSIEATCTGNEDNSLTFTSKATGTTSTIAITAPTAGTDITGAEYLNIADATSVSGKAAIPALGVTINTNPENQLIFTSKTSGAASKVILGSSTIGTDLATNEYLDLQSDMAVTTPGKEGYSGPEMLQDAILRAWDYGIFFGGILPSYIVPDSELLDASNLVQTSYALLFALKNDITYKEKGALFDQIRSKTNYKTRCLYYGLENPETFMAAYASAYMSINYNGSDTMINLNTKSLTGIEPDTTINDTILQQFREVGADVYSYTQGVGTVMCSGANEWFDTALSINWMAIALENAGLNALRQSTRISQTQRGINTLSASYEKVFQQAVRMGFVAPGKWTLPFTFGDPETFMNNVSSQGYYIYFEPLSTQNQSDRDRRIAPMGQAAIKLAGAVNISNLLVYINN